MRAHMERERAEQAKRIKLAKRAAHVEARPSGFAFENPRSVPRPPLARRPSDITSLSSTQSDNDQSDDSDDDQGPGINIEQLEKSAEYREARPQYC